MTQNDATTLSITTFCVRTLGILILSMTKNKTLSITSLTPEFEHAECNHAECHNGAYCAECHYTKCRGNYETLSFYMIIL